MARPSPARPPPLTRLNIWKTRARSSVGTPGPWSTHGQLDRTARGRPRRPSTGWPSGEWRTAFSTRLASTRSISSWSTSTGGRSAGRSTRTVPRWTAPVSSAPSTTSATGLIVAAQLERAGLDPGHVEQVVDQPVERVGLVLDQLEQLVAGRPADRSSPERCSVVTAVLTEASGVRRSWETAPIRASRQPVDLLEQLGPQRPVRGAGCARGPARPGWRTSGGAPSRGAGAGHRPSPPCRPAGRGR